VARSRPRVLLGIPFAQLISRIFRASFRSIAVRVGATSEISGRISNSLSGIRYPKSEMAPSGASDLAAILFTSGSTGTPKGVCYEHGMFDAQIRLVRDTYGIEPGEIDLPLLPIFALFDPALGMTAVVPELDPRRPAALDPAAIVQAIQQEGVTNSFGSPTLWRKIADHCLARNAVLPSLRRVLCAGAPVPASLWADAPRVLPNGRLHSPYGATEVLPVSTVAAGEIDATAVRGALVGRPLRANRVKIVAIHDGPIPTLAEARELPAGEIGEIIVTGPTVTREYDALPEATALAKIQTSSAKPQSGTDAPVPPETGNWELGTSTPTGAVWHRMGDAGFLDAEGRLWFCGRVAERVETADGPLFPEPCEQVFRRHPGVARCALIGLGPRGRQKPGVVVQPAESAVAMAPERFARELGELGSRHPHTAGIRRFWFRARFPLDVRHNAKIDRAALARWATTAKAVEVPRNK